jgi:hypothetical protein
VRRAPILCAIACGALYAATWSGRYVHDGAHFVQKLEEGVVLHIHLGYLLAAHALQRLLSPFGAIPAETTLCVLSVLSGAAAFLSTALLAQRVVGDSRVACAAAALAALSPVAWLHSSVVEVHIFSAAATSLAALLAYGSPRGPALGATAAVAAALFGHLSALFVIPSLLLLAFARRPSSEARAEPRLRAGAIAGSLAGALAGVVALWLLLWLAVGADWARPSSLGLLVPRDVPWLLRDPRTLAVRVGQEFFPAWGVLPAFVPLALLHRPRGTGGAAASVAAASASVAILAALAPPYDGMYTLILYPFLALAAALFLARATSGRAIPLLALLVGQVALAIPERIALAADVDRDWAERVSAGIERPALVFADGPGRARHVRRTAEVDARELGPVPAAEIDPLLASLDPARDPERAVYIDAQLVRRQGEFPGLSSLLSRLEIAEVGGGDLYRVTGLSRAPPK